MTRFDKTLAARRYAKPVVLMMSLPLTLVVMAWLSGGRMLVEKLLTAFLMPCGLLWIGLTSICVLAWLGQAKSICQSQPLFRGCVALWCAFTWLSNPMFAEWLIGTLERPYASIRPLQTEPPYDVLCLLGGSSMTGPNHEPQLGQSGDRIMLAARMYHAGKARLIVCTGTHIQGMTPDNQLQPKDETRILLTSLDVPSESIVLLDARNTYEELQQAAKLKQERPDERFGLLTSAWHLPRAMRLAKASGITIDPVPADFRTGPRKFSVLRLIPSDVALNQTRLAMHEYLGMLMGR